MVSIPECVPWLTVGLTECVAIVTLIIITIIVLVKNRNLRKRSTYLVINLAVADMLVGGIAARDLFYWFGAACNFLKYNSIDPWAFHVQATLVRLFLVSSVTNIAAISVERLHATLRPFRHRLIKKLKVKRNHFQFLVQFQLKNAKNLKSISFVVPFPPKTGITQVSFHMM